jgi:Rieske Fe-S protein
MASFMETLSTFLGAIRRNPQQHDILLVRRVRPGTPVFRLEAAPADLGPEWPGGFYCPCQGSTYDLAGSVFLNVPAPLNLDLPPYA